MLKKLLLFASPPVALYAAFVFVNLEPNVLNWSATSRYWLLSATLALWVLIYLAPLRSGDQSE